MSITYAGKTYYVETQKDLLHLLNRLIRSKVA